MHKVILTINLSDELVKEIYDLPPGTHDGIRLDTAKTNNILCNCHVHNRNGFHPNPAQRIFDVDVSSTKGNFLVLFGKKGTKAMKIKEVTLNGELEKIISFP